MRQYLMVAVPVIAAGRGVLEPRHGRLSVFATPRAFDPCPEGPLEAAPPLCNRRTLRVGAQVGAASGRPSVGIGHDTIARAHEAQQLRLRARSPAADAAPLRLRYRSSSLCSSGSESEASSSPSASDSENSGSDVAEAPSGTFGESAAPLGVPGSSRSGPRSVPSANSSASGGTTPSGAASSETPTLSSELATSASSSTSV